MDFCSDDINEYICVPVYHVSFFFIKILHPIFFQNLTHWSFSYFQQIWNAWSIKQKDFTVEEVVMKSVEQRLLRELDLDRLSEEHSAVAGMELTTNRDCFDAYKQFFCRLNFPMCVPSSGQILPVCLEDCTNAFANCGNDPSDCTDERVFKNISSEEEPPAHCE